MRGQKRQADDVAAAEHEFGFRLRRDAHDSALASERRCDVKISAAIEREALRAAQAAEKYADFAGGRNSVDAIEARSGGAGDEKFAGGTECQMIGRERRLERGEDENFAVRADLENRAAAIADVEIAAFVERDARGDAHAFDPLHRAAVGRNAVDGAVIAAGNEKIAVAIEWRGPWDSSVR